jgi:hypothetical protein
MHTEFTGAVWAIDSTTLYGLNTGNPAAAQITSSLKLLTDPNDITLRRVRIRGSYVYAIGYRNLYIVDVTNPAAPVLRSTTPFAGNPSLADVEVVGSYAYVCTGDTASPITSLIVVSIANPNAPSEVRRVGTDPTWRLAVPPGGGTLYSIYSVAFQPTHGIVQWNLSNAANPTVQAANTTIGTGAGDELVVTSAQMAHLNNQLAGIGSIDMLDPATMNQIGFSAPPYFPAVNGIAVDWPRLLAAEDYGGMDFVNITDPSNPMTTLRYLEVPPGTSYSIANDGGGYTAIAGGLAGAWLFDTTTGTPRLITHISPPDNSGWSINVAKISADVAFFVQTNNLIPQYSTILAYQVTPGANPTAVLAGSYNIPTSSPGGGVVFAMDVGADANNTRRVFYTTGFPSQGATLHTLNATNLAAMVHDGQFALTAGVGDPIKFVQSGAFPPAPPRILASDDFVGASTQIINVSLASSMSNLGVIPAGAGAIGFGLSNAWLAQGGTLRCFNISNPAVPVARGVVQIAGPTDHARAFRFTDIFGSNASVLTQNGTLVRVNTSNPDSPSVTQIATISSEAFDLAFDGSGQHVAAGVEGYKVVSLSFTAPPAENPGQALASRTLCQTSPNALHAAFVASPAVSSYQWYKNGSPVADGPTVDGATITGSATADLSVSGAGIAEAGAYFCRATNACGTGDTGAATLSFCYPNCDCSTASPVLNVLDFTCFLQQFAAANPYANCDASTTPPTLNVLDFTCFLRQFATGCP